MFVYSTITSPAWAEVLTSSFVIRLKEMEELIQDQKQVIDIFKLGTYNKSLWYLSREHDYRQD